MLSLILSRGEVRDPRLSLLTFSKLRLNLGGVFIFGVWSFTSPLPNKSSPGTGLPARRLGERGGIGSNFAGPASTSYYKAATISENYARVTSGRNSKSYFFKMKSYSTTESTGRGGGAGATACAARASSSSSLDLRSRRSSISSAFYCGSSM